jgi:hypothetical protein
VASFCEGVASFGITSKVRLIPRAEGKKYGKGKKNGSRLRAERADIVHEMTTEEARNTEVNITRTESGRYGNAHIIYDMNDGLVDTILEVTPTTGQQAGGLKEQKDRKNDHTATKEKEHEISEKYKPRSIGSACDT